MLSHTIEAARKSGLAEKVYVCTEDDEIAETSGRWGAEVFRIPGSMAGDEVSSTVPCLELYDSLTRQGEDFDFLFNLQPSSPCRTAADIRDSLDTLFEKKADFLVSATFIDSHFFHWALQEKEQGWEMYFGEMYLKERPQLPPVYRPNGAIKLARAAAVRETGNFFGRPLAVHFMPDERGIHVAERFDLDCAQAMLEKRAAPQETL